MYRPPAPSPAPSPVQPHRPALPLLASPSPPSCACHPSPPAWAAALDHRHSSRPRLSAPPPSRPPRVPPTLSPRRRQPPPIGPISPGRHPPPPAAPRPPQPVARRPRALPAKAAIAVVVWYWPIALLQLCHTFRKKAGAEAGTSSPPIGYRSASTPRGARGVRTPAPRGRRPPPS